MTIQKEIILPPFKRGVYLITEYISSNIEGIETGLANVFLKHSSASLAINENYDPAVRRDVETFLRSMIPDGWRGFTHTLEGKDDMPAHMKNILIGSTVTIPVTNGKLNMGIWQGIYLLEHREYSDSRKIVLTLMGD